MNLDNTLRILSDLVAFPVLGGDSNLAIIDYIGRYLDGHGVPYHLVKNAEGDKASLHCRIGPAVDGGVVLSGHTDVVPVAGQDWHTAPFVLTRQGNRLYARGSADMKGFVACCLASVPVFLAANMARPVYFAFSYDEEIGCLAGTELALAIRAHYQEAPRYAIIGEPSRMQPIVGQKGICVMETTVHGSAGHSSRIPMEVSALHTAARLVCWLEEKMNGLVAEGRSDRRFQPPHSTLHVGMMQSGIAPNVIADKCVFHWDVRTIPQDSLADIVADFEAYSRSLEAELRPRFAGTRIDTREHHPPVVPLDTAETSSVVPIIQRLCGHTALHTVSYASEAGQFAEAGFEAVICGPGDIAQAHRADEFIDISELEKCLVMLERLSKE